MRESVSAVFVTKDSVYFIKRQNYLPIFPGYYATPGGKVDKTDKTESLAHSIRLCKLHHKSFMHL